MTTTIPRFCEDTIVEYTFVTIKFSNLFTEAETKWGLRKIISSKKKQFDVRVLESMIGDNYLRLTCRIVDDEAFFAFKHVLMTNIARWYNDRYKHKSAVFSKGPRILIKEPGMEPYVISGGPQIFAGRSTRTYDRTPSRWVRGKYTIRRPNRRLQRHILMRLRRNGALNRQVMYRSTTTQEAW